MSLQIYNNMLTQQTISFEKNYSKETCNITVMNHLHIFTLIKNNFTLHQFGISILLQAENK